MRCRISAAIWWGIAWILNFSTRCRMQEKKKFTFIAFWWEEDAAAAVYDGNNSVDWFTISISYYYYLLYTHTYVKISKTH